MSWQPIETAPRDGTWILVAEHDPTVSAGWIAMMARWGIEYGTPHWCGLSYEFSPKNPPIWHPMPSDAASES